MIIKRMESGILAANTYFVCDEESKKGFLVDPGGRNDNMVNFIAECGCTPEYIILTHGHCDHMAGVPFYKELFPEIKVVACAAEKEVLADPNQNFCRMIGQTISMEADIWVNDGDALTVGGMELKFLHTPGHSPGGMCISVGDILLSGDTLFKNSIGRTDFPNASFEDLKNAVHEKIFVLPDETRVFPGHMGETTVGFEKRNNPFV